MKRILKAVLAGHQWRRATGWMVYLLIAIAICLPAMLVPAGEAEAATPAKIAAYLNGTWYLDYNGNGVWNGTGTGNDRLYTFGNAAMKPVTGDWDKDRITEPGVYSNGTWYLDYNGNGVWNGTGTGNDRLYNFGNASMKPVTGDWNEDGITEVAAYLNGTWYLDYNGNGAWDGSFIDRQCAFGNSSMTPVSGDWNRDGITEVGAYLNGTWYLDYNGNGAWNGAVTDRLYSFGNASMKPVTGDWNGDGYPKLGAYYNGKWYMDYNGNGAWDGSFIDRQCTFGNSSMIPVNFVTPPIISAVNTSFITTSSVTITWATNVAATSQVDYGTGNSYGFTTPLDTDLITSHSVDLSGLNAQTTYHFRVKSRDAAGNETVDSDRTFATLGPPIPSENGTYINYDYLFSVQYPATWTSQTVTLSGDVFYAKGTDKDIVHIAIRPATDFKDAATTYLTDLIAERGVSLTPGIDSESIVTLSDGTQAIQILYSALFGSNKFAITGVLKDGNAIMVCGASDPKNMDLYKAIGQTLTFWTGTSFGDRAPNFTLACVDGSQVTLSALQGKKVIINFWNLNCHYSMEEMPYFQEVRAKYPESSIAMLMVNTAAGGFPANRPEAVAAAIEAAGYTFTVPLDESGAVAGAYNVSSGIPVTFFIDSSGIIKSKQDGSFPNVADIETRLNSY